MRALIGPWQGLLEALEVMHVYVSILCTAYDVHM
jgi:hypothetical protein